MGYPDDHVRRFNSVIVLSERVWQNGQIRSKRLFLKTRNLRFGAIGNEKIRQLTLFSKQKREKGAQISKKFRQKYHR